MDYEELRPFVLDFLKQAPENLVLEVLGLTRAVEQKLLQQGFYQDRPVTITGTTGTHRMPDQDLEKVREIISELVIQGILIWGWNLENPAPPFLRITQYGRESLRAGQPIPHDPDGYLSYLKKEIPTVDETILVYVSEALQAYLRGLTLSSTVMLGGAAEKAFLLLIDSYANAITDVRKQERFRKEASGPIKRKIDAFRREVATFRSRLPRSLEDDLDIQLDGILNLIRNCRNDVGHPTGRRIDRQLAYANLRLFVGYCKRAYDLMTFFQSNTL